MIAKNQFKPNWLMSDGFGFKFLAFNWDKIEALYNQSKPKILIKKWIHSSAKRYDFAKLWQGCVGSMSWSKQGVRKN